MINLVELNRLLKEAANNQLPELEQKLRLKLTVREGLLLDWLFLQYQNENNRRWYDPYHILFSTNFAVELIQVEKLDRLIIAGIILHDIGYFALEDKTQWSNSDSRITHMQEGTALAARVLSENQFAADELEKVLGMIAVHDNPYLGLEIKGRDRLGLRDCDRVWVMHVLSFYKDLVSRPERYNESHDFLLDRMIQFYSWKNPFGYEWEVSIKSIKKNAHRIEIPTYNHTRQYIHRQFSSRVSELCDSHILQDDNAFRLFLSDQLLKE